MSALVRTSLCAALLLGTLASCRRGRHASHDRTGVGPLRVVSEHLEPDPGDAGLPLATSGTLRYEVAIDGAMDEGERFTVRWLCEQCAGVDGGNVPIDSAAVTLSRAILASRPVVVAGQLSRPETGWVAGTYRVEALRGSTLFQSRRFAMVATDSVEHD